jgi:hypothetical protein
MAATDTFVNSQGGLQSPPTNSFAITPSDLNELPFVTREIYVGGAGNITLRLANDSASVVLTSVPAGTRLSYRVRQIYATGTTATALVGLY